MRIRLERALNILGLEWPQGEHDVQDLHWLRELLAAGAQVIEAEPGDGPPSADMQNESEQPRPGVFTTADLPRRRRGRPRTSP